MLFQLHFFFVVNIDFNSIQYCRHYFTDALLATYCYLQCYYTLGLRNRLKTALTFHLFT